MKCFIGTSIDCRLVRLVAAAVRTGPQLINKLKEGWNVDAVKTLSAVSNTLVMRTPMGVPLSLNVSAMGIVKLEGMIKANSLPELSHFLLRRPYMSRKIEIVSDIKPRYDIQLPTRLLLIIDAYNMDKIHCSPVSYHIQCLRIDCHFGHFNRLCYLLTYLLTRRPVLLLSCKC